MREQSTGRPLKQQRGDRYEEVPAASVSLTATTTLASNNSNMQRYNSQLSSTSTHSHNLLQRSNAKSDDDDVELALIDGILNNNNDSSSSPFLSSAATALATTTTTATTNEILKNLAFSVIWFLVGWYMPKQLAPTKEYLQNRTAPYQIVSYGGGGDAIIVDFDLDHPLVDPPTIPSTALIVSAIWVPIFIIAIFSFWSCFNNSSNNNNNTYNTRATFSSCFHRFVVHLSILLTCLGLSEGTTQLLKLFVMRRRPNFYKLCQFDLSTRTCTADFHHQLEAQMSFPSGHSSLVFCGMTFCVFFLHSQLLTTTTTHHKMLSSLSSSPTTLSSCGGTVLAWGIRIVCYLVPFWWAMYVAATRIRDFWHHPSDVLAGSLLGSWATWWVWQFCQTTTATTITTTSNN